MVRSNPLFSLVAIATTVLLAPQVAAQGLAPDSQDTFERQQDLVLSIQAIAGSCPTQVRFWRESGYFEPGEKLGIMLDVSSIGQGETKFINSQDNSVTFRTSLKPEFYSCIGTLGHSEERHRRLLNLVFSQGHMYFHFDISPIKPVNDNTYFVTIVHQEIVGQYPYVRWVVGD